MSNRLFDPFGQVIHPLLWAALIVAVVLRGAPGWAAAIVGFGVGMVWAIALLEWGVPMRFLHFDARSALTKLDHR